MVVFAGSIFSGLQAMKTETTALESFAAPHGGPIGRVEEGRVEYAVAARHALLPPPPPPRHPPALTARVALVPMMIGDRGELLDLARPTHDGVVVVAFGGGNIPPGAGAAVKRWLGEGKPVVLASRCLTGQVTATYAFPGGGATLIREGVIPAGPRTPSQARMELVISLSAGVEYGD